jgi:DNA invertase Pin-like site-specific DNA recombinase
MKCGLYARVSTTKQESDNQLDQLREFARVVGWEVGGGIRRSDHG